MIALQTADTSSRQRGSPTETRPQLSDSKLSTASPGGIFLECCSNPRCQWTLVYRVLVRLARSSGQNSGHWKATRVPVGSTRLGIPDAIVNHVLVYTACKSGIRIIRLIYYTVATEQDLQAEICTSKKNMTV
jgi:hypothetical protein